MDTANKFLVGSNGDKLVIQNTPRGPISKDDALVLAAWLVALADPGGTQFAWVLADVMGT